MKPLDPHTLWLVVAVQGVAATCAFTLLWRRTPGLPGLGPIALGQGIIAASGALVAGAGRIPYLLSFTAANSLGVLGAALLVEGVRQLHGLPARRRLALSLFAGVALGLSLFGYSRVEQEPALLALAIAGPNVILGALFADAAFAALRRGRRPGEGSIAALIALAFSVMGASHLLVAGMAVSGPRASAYWKGQGGGDPLLAASLLLSVAASLGWAFGLFASVNHRLTVANRRQAEYRASLNNVALGVLNRLELTPLLEALVSRGAALLDAERGFLYLETPDATALRCRVWVGDRPVDELVAADEGAVGRSWRRCEPVIVADYDSWPGRSPIVPSGIFGSMLAVPLRSAGRAVGSLGVARARPGRRFDADQVALLLGFSDLASLALDNALLFERERDARERAERLQAATRSLTGSLDPQAVFDSILRELERVVPADAVTIQKLAATQLEIVAARGYAAPFLSRSVDAEAGDRRRARVLEGREPLIVNDAPLLPDAHWAGSPSELHSWLGVPLLYGGQAIGVLALAKREHAFYTPDHARVALAFADQAAVAIENARLYQEARKEIEERRRAQQALEQSESRYRDLFEQSLGLVYTHDLTGTLLSANPAAAKALGLEPPALVGRNLAELLPEAQRAGLHAYLQQLQRDGHATGTMTVLSPAGEPRAWSYSNVLRRAPDESPYAIGFAQDITPLKRAEELRADLVRTIVHDLRAPLTGIVAGLDLLRSGAGRAHDDVLELATRSAERLRRLVDGILDIDRLEHGALPLQRGAVALADAAAEACSLVGGAAEQKGVSLTQAVEATLPRAWADPELLLRVLINLLANAVTFTPAGGRVVVNAEPAAAGMLRVRVQDTGPGIPDDLAPLLFQKFVTGRSKGAGSGLGLAFCRLVVEAHGGRIGIEAGASCGASLAFTLPAAPGGMPAA